VHALAVAAGAAVLRAHRVDAAMAALRVAAAIAAERQN